MCTCTLECCCSCVVVHKVFDSLFCEPHLPAKRQRQLLGHRESRVLPLSGLTLMVHKVHTLVGQHSFLYMYQCSVCGWVGVKHITRSLKESGKFTV